MMMLSDDTLRSFEKLGKKNGFLSFKTEDGIIHLPPGGDRMPVGNGDVTNGAVKYPRVMLCQAPNYTPTVSVTIVRGTDQVSCVECIGRLKTR